MEDRSQPRLGGPSLDQNPNWNPYQVLVDTAGEIWNWLVKHRHGDEFKDGGPEMHFVFVGKPASQCHHFAFGNLKGNQDDYSLSKVFPETLGDPFTVLDEGDKVCPSGTWGKHGPEQQVCLLGSSAPPTDHSARQEMPGGLWWHKFIDLPYILGFRSPKIFGYKVTEYVTVKTGKGNYDSKGVLWEKPDTQL